jgi:hypothetical protein
MACTPAATSRCRARPAGRPASASAVGARPGARKRAIRPIAGPHTKACSTSAPTSKLARADAGAQPGLHIAGCAARPVAQRLHGGSSTPAARPRQPAWAAATARPSRNAEQHRQAVGHHARCRPRPAAVVQAGIGWRAGRGLGGGVQAQHLGAMHLLQPHRPRAQACKAARLRATAAGSSPTLSARFRLSQGAALTPPSCAGSWPRPRPVVPASRAATTPAGRMPQSASGQARGGCVQRRRASCRHRTHASRGAHGRCGSRSAGR